MKDLLGLEVPAPPAMNAPLPWQYFEAKTPQAMGRADAVAGELLKTSSTKAKQVFSDHQPSPADSSATSSMQPRLSGAEVAGDRQAFIGDPPHCPNCGCEEVDTDGC